VLPKAAGLGWPRLRRATSQAATPGANSTCFRRWSVLKNRFSEDEPFSRTVFLKRNRSQEPFSVSFRQTAQVEESNVPGAGRELHLLPRRDRI